MNIKKIQNILKRNDKSYMDLFEESDMHERNMDIFAEELVRNLLAQIEASDLLSPDNDKGKTDYNEETYMNLLLEKIIEKLQNELNNL